MSNVFRSLLAAMLLPQVAGAQVVITEIMYDPPGSDTGREWIEIYNAGASPVDMTRLRLSEDGANHKISAVGGASLAPASYAIIADNPARFKTDWPGYAGALFDSSFSLSNAGETVELKDVSGASISTIAYDSADGGTNGNSLNREPDSKVVFSRAPTPGALAARAAIPAPAPKAQSRKTPRVSKRSGSARAIFRRDASSGAPLPELGDTIRSGVAPAQGAAAANNSLPWWVAAGVLSLLAAFALLAARRAGRGEWTIVEDADE